MKNLFLLIVTFLTCIEPLLSQVGFDLYPLERVDFVFNKTSMPELRLKEDAVLFREDFSGKLTPSNIWRSEYTGRGTIEQTKDKVFGPCIKISQNNTSGNTFLHVFFKGEDAKKLLGKKIWIGALVKSEGIEETESDAYQGQICFSFTYNGQEYYEAVRYIEGTFNWQYLIASADGRREANADDTSLGPNVFQIPEGATNLRFYIGMQQSKGTVYITDIKFYDAEKQLPFNPYSR